MTLVCYSASAPTSSFEEAKDSARNDRQIFLSPSSPDTVRGVTQVNPRSILSEKDLSEARSKPASEASILLEKDGVFYSHSDIDTPEELTDHIFKKSQASLHAPNTGFSSSQGSADPRPSFYSSPTQPTRINGRYPSSFDNQFVGPQNVPLTYFAAQPFASGHLLAVSQQPLSPEYQPFSPEYQPFSPEYQPFSPEYQPFSSEYHPFSPTYHPFAFQQPGFPSPSQPFTLSQSPFSSQQQSAFVQQPLAFALHPFAVSQPISPTQYSRPIATSVISYPSTLR